MNSAIENLYLVFNQYTTSGLHYCDCGCININDVKKLASKPLRKLEEEDLASYHGSALYTWGEIEHYKHFLPRLFEIYSIDRNTYVGIEDIKIKLDYSKWQNWNNTEKEAINKFIVNDWKDLLYNSNSEIGIDTIISYASYISLDKVFNIWEISKNEKSIRKFVSFIYHYGNDVLYKNFYGDNSNKLLLQFINNNNIIEILENSFFKYEKTESEYAKEISIVLQIIEFKLKLDKQ